MLSSERVARLAFLDDDDHPRVLPVTFAVADGFLWTAVDQKPKRSDGREIARLRFLRRTPDAALVVDHYDDDWSRLAWVQLLGWVDILDASDAHAGLDALVAKYLPYREERPPGPVLRFDVVRALHWRASEG
jgi:PPOX class probable F420-dependent enzyme